MEIKSSQKLVRIPADSVDLEGTLVIPQGAKAIVIFVHGAGSSRLSPRNNFVAQVLNDAGLGTFLFDLLTEEEDIVYENRFDLTLLTSRLKTATGWLRDQPLARKLSLGYFGASTGAAAAIITAAESGASIGAVVSRGGRPDLAKQALGELATPTLLIVGGEDDVVLELNQEAYEQIKAEKDLKVIPGATHLFEEPGALEEVSRLAANWFKKHISSRE